MKRFNLFRFVFALVCGCHINGVKSQTCDAGYYLNVKGVCTRFPYDDQSIVVEPVPEFLRCGAFDNTLMVKKYEYTKKVHSMKYCQGHCLSDRNCTHFEFDENNKKCSIIGTESFGTKDKNVVSGYGECPKNDKCQNFGANYIYGTLRLFKTNIKSPKDCQKLCRRKDSATVFSYRFSDQHSSSVRRDCYCHDARSFTFDDDINWISGDSRCPRCFFYHTKLRNLRNVGIGGQHPYIKKPTVGACQRSCRDDLLCKWFEFDRRNNECRHKNFGEMKKKNVVYGSRYCNCDCNKNAIYGCSHYNVCLCNPGYIGPRCDRCADEYYMPNSSAKICNHCKCDLYGSKSRNCDTKSGQCPCWFDSYEGLRCEKCVSTQVKANGRCCFKGDFYNLKADRCQDCNCDQYGSKSRECNVNTGQCPCWFDSYQGRRCETCVKGQRKLHGRCCWYYQWFDTSEKRCKDCGCNREGSTCDGSTGNCRCKWRYKGTYCNDITRNTAAFEPNGRFANPRKSGNMWYVVLQFKCHTSCDLRYIEIQSKGVDVDLWGSTAKWSASGSSWFKTSGTTFCHEKGGSKAGETCKGKQSALKGHKIFWLLLYSHKEFYYSKFYYELGNVQQVGLCGGFC